MAIKKILSFALIILSTSLVGCAGMTMQETTAYGDLRSSCYYEYKKVNPIIEALYKKHNRSIGSSTVFFVEQPNGKTKAMESYVNNPFKKYTMIVDTCVEESNDISYNDLNVGTTPEGTYLAELIENQEKEEIFEKEMKRKALELGVPVRKRLPKFRANTSRRSTTCTVSSYGTGISHTVTTSCY